jgi:hypothetical protein
MTRKATQPKPSLKTPPQLISGRIIAFLSSDTFLKITFAWFIIQAIYFAACIVFRLPPDETYHYNFIQLFAQHTPSPFLPDQGNFVRLSESVRNPFFIYHYLLSFPYLLIQGWDHAYLLLRGLNIGLGVGSLYFTYRIANLLKVSALVRNLSIFMLANTLMFVFLAGSINYDNLFILVSLATIFLFIKLYKQFSVTTTLLLVSCLLGGSMVKVNFLPIAFFVVIVLVARYFREVPKILSTFVPTFLKAKRLNSLILILITLLGGLFVQRYAANLVSYGTYAPSCEQVRSIEDCRKNSLFKRNEYVRGEGRKKATMNLPQYVVYWADLMKDRIYGVFTSGDRNIAPNKYAVLWLFLLAVAWIVAVIRLVSRKDGLLLLVLGVGVFYAVMLLHENYSIYQGTGRPSLALQGRYALVVLPLLYLVGNHYLEKLLKNVRLVALFAVVTIVLFALSSLPTFLRRSTPMWYQQYGVNANSLIDYRPTEAPKV